MSPEPASLLMSRHTAADRSVVLVVDDSPGSLGVLCDTLESAAYTVRVASDGEGPAAPGRGHLP